MNKEITLPSGATVELRDASTLKVKDRKKLYRLTEGEGNDIDKAFKFNESAIAIFVVKWSLSLPIPSESLESLEEMDLADFDFLEGETKVLQKVLFPSLAETVENELDPKATSVVSNG